jgi:ribonuclease HII
MNVSFIEAADSKYFSTALASMFSKYIRELFVRLFNTYWQEQIKDLKPTAGYPEDAKRFLSQIDQTKQRLGISDDILIRMK